MRKKNILLVIVIVEILYIVSLYFYSLQLQVQFVQNWFYKKPSSIIQDQSQAYNNDTLDRIRQISSFAVSSATLQNTYSGIITGIQKNTKKSALYPLIFTIRGKNNLENTFLFTRNDFTKLQIILKKSEFSPIKDKQLHEGDFVNIEEEIDVLKPFSQSRKSLIITVQ